MKNLKRNKQIIFRVSEEEKEHIQKMFEKSGEQNMGRFLRKSIFNTNFYTVDLTPLDEHSKQIILIGRNINQIAKKINTTNKIKENEMQEISSMINEIYLMEKKIYKIFLNAMKGE